MRSSRTSVERTHIQTYIQTDRQTDGQTDVVGGNNPRDAVESYVHEPNFMLQCWSSNGNQLMSILHVLWNMPGGTQRQPPSLDTTTFVGNVLSMSSSALHAQ